MKYRVYSKVKDLIADLQELPPESLWDGTEEGIIVYVKDNGEVFIPDSNDIARMPDFSKGGG